MKPATTTYSTRSSGDRRQGPRREAERHLHYARENLLAAALALISISDDGQYPDLENAAEQYRRAEKAAR